MRAQAKTNKHYRTAAGLSVDTKSFAVAQFDLEEFIKPMFIRMEWNGNVCVAHCRVRSVFLLYAT